MPERRFEFQHLLSARGLPEADVATMAGLHDIVDEGVLGASNHVALALPLVARLARADRATALDEARALAGFIAATRGSAAPIVANALAWQTRAIDGLAQGDAADLLAARAAEWDGNAKARRSQLISHAVEKLSSMRVPLLFDYSSTVADVVRACADQGCLDRLVIPESRAIDGGRRYMTALSDLGVPILFLPDAAMEYAAGHSDALLLGAESVTRDGGVINTVGSLPAARAARARGIPVYGAADLYKVGAADAADVPPPPPRSYPFLLAEGETATTEAPELEIVPPGLVTALLTEVGPLAPDALSQALSQAVSGVVNTDPAGA
ncbi:MAG: hypothetical protein NXH97_21690 [Rhodobacteraceae bacterium]|nr:hypothetical protein [Paracoccaceae bacterium]